MKTDYERIRFARQNIRHLSQAELGEMVGITQPGINKIEKGKIKSPLDIEKFAKALKVNKSWLGFGEGPPTNETITTIPENESPKKPYKVTVYIDNTKNLPSSKIIYGPIISWAQAANFDEIVHEILEDRFIERVVIVAESCRRCFALQIKGDSMVRAFSPSFPEGAHIVVDPDKMPQSGNFVIATLENLPEAIFRQLRVEAGESYLIALNTVYKPILVDKNVKIVGVVIEERTKLC